MTDPGAGAAVEAEAPAPARRAVPPWAIVLVAFVPWAWFVLRDAGGGIDGGSLQTLLDGISLLLPFWGLVGVAVLVAVALLLRDWRCTVAALSWLVFVVVACVAPWLPDRTDPPRDAVHVVSVNLLATNKSDGTAGDVLDRDADIVVAVETNGKQYVALRRELGEPAGIGGDEGVCSIGKGTCSSVNVWSRYPARVAGSQAVARALRGIRLRVDGPGGPFVLYALHSRAPVPFRNGGGKVDPAEQRRLLDDLLEAATAERLPVVIAGDMNMPDRTSSYRAYAADLHDAVRSSFAWPTSLKWFQAPLLLRIDHIWISDDWCAEGGGSFPLTGSDHRGVEAAVGPCRSG